MKRNISVIVALVIGIQLLAIPAFADNMQVETSLASVEIQEELAAAEEILGGPCKLQSVETDFVGDYIVESRFYVLDTPQTRASSGKVGGVSSHVWRPYFESEWTVKVLLASYFFYNGTTAICIPEETDAWSVTSDGADNTSRLSTTITHSDGSTAKTSCRYSIMIGGSPSISATIGVTCSKTGTVGIVTEEEHRY